MKSKMLNFLKRVFKLEQAKKVLSPEYRYAFTSVSGYKYYYIIGTENLDASAVNKFNTARYFDNLYPAVWEFHQGLQAKEIENWIEQTENFDKIEQYKYAVMALSERLKVSFDPDIFFAVCAALYFREDEPNRKMDSTLLLEKIEDIKKTVQVSESFFFHFPLLSELVKLSNMSAMNWLILSKNMEAQNLLFQQVLKKIKNGI